MEQSGQLGAVCEGEVVRERYTRSPLQDSRLFGPRPWKILAATNQKRFLSNPGPGENLVSGNLVMETGCTNQPHCSKFAICVLLS